MVEASTHSPLSCTLNADFKLSTRSHPFISMLITTLKDQYESETSLSEDQEVLETQAKEIIAKVKQAILDFVIDDFESLIHFLMSFYLRENSLGPSVYTEYVEETRAPLEKNHLPVTEFDPISNKNKLLQFALLEHFSRDGETLYQRSQMLVLLLCVETLLSTHIDPAHTPRLEFVTLYRARMSFLLDRHLSSSVLNLKDASLDHYKWLVQVARDKV